VAFAPQARFIALLRYQSEVVGPQTPLSEERSTSTCSFLDSDPPPIAEPAHPTPSAVSGGSSAGALARRMDGTSTRARRAHPISAEKESQPPLATGEGVHHYTPSGSTWRMGGVDMGGVDMGGMPPRTMRSAIGVQRTSFHGSAFGVSLRSGASP